MTFGEFPDNDPQFQDVTITKSEANEHESGGWYIGLSTGWSFYVPPESPVTPEPGMACRLYGKGIGYTVRGLFLDGRRVFYRTEAEERAKHEEECRERDRERRYDFEKSRSDLDRRYRELPEVFRQRLDRFREANPDFRWEYEPYELFTCEQAVVMADFFRPLCPDAQPESPQFAKRLQLEMDNFRELDWESQKSEMEALSDGHSGNTFGCAMALAYQYLTTPGNVAIMNGAMEVVVGSKAFRNLPDTKRFP